MARVRMDLLGAKELIAAFQKLDEVVGTHYIAQALHEGVDYMAGLISAKTPSLTGKLRAAEHITAADIRRKLVNEDIVIDDKAAPYWKYVEFGHAATGHTPMSKIAPESRGKLTRVKPVKFIRQTLKNRKTTARQVIRDSFRDLMMGFKP